MKSKEPKNEGVSIQIQTFKNRAILTASTVVSATDNGSECKSASGGHRN